MPKVIPIRPLTAAQSELVRKNMGLVGKMYNLVAKRNKLVLRMGFDDAAQEGYVILCRAAQLFDPSRGSQFSTYACNAIYQGLEAAAARHLLTPIPRDVARAVLYNERGTLSDTQWARAQAAVAVRGHMSDWQEAEIPEPEPPPTYDGMTFDALIRDLSPREQIIMRRRFFLGESLSQVGEHLGLTKERVRQIQAQAVRRARLLAEKGRVQYAIAE